jgi:glycosyltransferase involved in cell wall biosynthesis
VERKSDRIRILCSGDPRPRKGFITVLDAIEIVKKYIPDIALDAYYGKGISQEQMSHVYSSADIFVDAQWYAGWNNPVAEAMACKVPVVCSNIGGVKDFAFHEQTALLVPVKDAQALAQAILRLIRNKPLQEKLGENAFTHIARFRWPDSAENLENILEAALQGGRP